MTRQSHVSWWVELAVRPSDLARFRTLTRRMVEAAECEPGALIYERFTDEASGRVLVHERYESSEAARAHLQAFKGQLASEFAQLATRRHFVVLGSPDAELRSVLAHFDPSYASPIAGFFRSKG